MGDEGTHYDLSPFDTFAAIDVGFAVFFVIFAIAFVSILGLIIYAGVKQARKTSRDNAAPEVTAVATVVAKRIETHGGGETSVSQHHFATFEQTTGVRFELEVAASEYGMLVEGDTGTVSMKGSRYLGFARELLR